MITAHRRQILLKMADEKINGIPWQNEKTQYIKVSIETTEWTFLPDIEPMLSPPGERQPIEVSMENRSIPLLTHGIDLEGKTLAWFKMMANKEKNIVVYTDLVFGNWRLTDIDLEIGD